jgi:hypothetical protein
VSRQKPRQPSPYAWLWEEIARRFGDEAAKKLHEDYLVQHRAYGQKKWHSPESPDSSKVKPGRKVRRR